MADTVGQADIRGLDIDKTVKGFALMEYIFKQDCSQSGTVGDSIRWYQETAADLTATAPMRVANTAFTAKFATLDPSWTRNTSYVQQYSVESFIPMMDIKTADIDVLSRVLLRLTRAVTKQVDARVWNVLTQDRNLATIGTADTGINIVTSSGAWTADTSNPIRDVLKAKEMIWVSGGYNPESAKLYLSPADHTNLLNYLIWVKGSSVPAFSSEKLGSGVVMRFLGLDVKVSDNVTADYALVAITERACTWKTLQGITSKVVEHPGKGSDVIVWEIGEPILTDPKAVCIISNTQ